MNNIGLAAKNEHMTEEKTITSIPLLAYCGVDCSVCQDYIGGKCPGCRESDWSGGDACLPVGCCREKGIECCGECSDFPCADIAKFYEESDSHREAGRRMRLKAKQRSASPIRLEPLPQVFSVCKLADFTSVDLTAPFVFTAATDGENSLVCPTGLVPEDAVRCDDGWRCFRVCGELDFSLIGILAGISEVLAEEKIGIFVVSTFNTDYVLTKEADFEKALSALKRAGYQVME